MQSLFITRNGTLVPEVYPQAPPDIDDRYLRGIKEWQVDRYELVDVVMEAQDRFEAQIELQKLYAHTRLYLPADYTED